MIHRRTIDRKEKDMSFFQFSDEELRARFTNWLEKTLFRERIKYLIKSQAHSQEIPLELISREVVPVFSESGCSDDGFYFTNVALSSAYYILNPNQRRLLVLLYVYNLKPSDIADMLPHKSKCSIYSDKYRILEELRNYLPIHDN